MRLLSFSPRIDPLKPRSFATQALLCLVLGCGLVGCQNWAALQGPGFRDEFAKEGQRMRPKKKGDGGRTLGLSSKSRQIEADLGIE
jgi:hypothetical protein